MPGDWIAMRGDLADDPAVIAIGFAVKLKPDFVVGKLHRLWSWADRNTIDGRLPGVPLEWIDEHLGVKGFGGAMASLKDSDGQPCPWLIADETGLTIPRFERWNGDSAKARLSNTKRQQLSRNKRDEGATDARHHHDTSATTEQNRTDLLLLTDHTNKRSDQTEQPPVARFARQLFDKIGYHGSDGKLLWQAAHLLHAGLLKESDAYDAAQATHECADQNPVGYFRHALAERLGGAKQLKALLKHAPKVTMTGPPPTDCQNGQKETHARNS